MIFKPKISHQKPIKPPLKADFNAYFTKKRMIFTRFTKYVQLLRGRSWFDSQREYQTKKSLWALFCLAFGAETNPRFAPPLAVARAQNRARQTECADLREVFPAEILFFKSLRALFLFGFRCGSRPAVRPIAQQWHEERSDEVFPAGVLHQRKSAYECRSKRTAR